MEETTHKALWCVSLSNGENHYEEKGKFEVIPGELSPWQRLKEYIQSNSLQITSLSVYTKDGRRFNLPSRGKNQKFKAFGEVAPPLSYNMVRKMGGDLQGSSIINKDLFIVIEAEYENHTVQLWVDNELFNCWTLTTNK